MVLVVLASASCSWWCSCTWRCWSSSHHVNQVIMLIKLSCHQVNLLIILVPLIIIDQVLYNICAHHLVVVLMQEELIVFTFMLVLFQGLEKNSVKFCNFWDRCKDGILDILIIYICKNITLCSWSCSLVWLWMWSW